jgi:hypothetical protein
MGRRQQRNDRSRWPNFVNTGSLASDGDGYLFAIRTHFNCGQSSQRRKALLCSGSGTHVQHTNPGSRAGVENRDLTIGRPSCAFRRLELIGDGASYYLCAQSGDKKALTLFAGNSMRTLRRRRGEVKTAQQRRTADP